MNAAQGVVSEIERDIEALNAFFVYSDIVGHQYIGDKYTKILRVVALDNEVGSNALYMSKIYDVPHYVPVARNNIETIDISLVSDTGEQILFKSGKVVVKLHFRRKYFS